jgi:Pentapeptide repeats (8 copies)
MDESAGRWSARVVAITAMFSVAVAGLTVFYTNQANQELIGLSRRGQIADRFSRAVDQIGQEDKLDVRLGGIYAMGQIMSDSVSDVDETAIVDILCAFIRAHATDSKRESPTADVQAALTVIGKRPNFDKPNFGTVDLGGSALKGARLRGAHLEGAHLEHVLLDIADLDDAFLTAANLDGVVLFNTSLVGAHLDHADLTDACMDENTHLSGAHFDGAVLSHAHLENSDLSGVLGLTSARVQDVYVNKNTKLPAGVVPPSPATQSSC